MQTVTLDIWPKGDPLTFMESDEGSVTCKLYVELERPSSDDKWNPVYIDVAEWKLWPDESAWGFDVETTGQPRKEDVAATHWWNKPHIQARYGDALQRAACERWEEERE